MSKKVSFLNPRKTRGGHAGVRKRTLAAVKRGAKVEPHVSPWGERGIRITEEDRKILNS